MYIKLRSLIEICVDGSVMHVDICVHLHYSKEGRPCQNHMNTSTYFCLIIQSKSIRQFCNIVIVGRIECPISEFLSTRLSTESRIIEGPEWPRSYLCPLSLLPSLSCKSG